MNQDYLLFAAKQAILALDAATHHTVNLDVVLCDLIAAVKIYEENKNA